ncbi:hypothetical protein GCM10010255_70330 [Streptomyces coeruleofuscus]|uniref:Uncharacterized protein n=1 Tax=Streptomyces coeruleofuscus TaxID=66879 RepID=A0ABP5W563_9ACTN
MYLLRLLGGLADTSGARLVIFLTPCWWKGLQRGSRHEPGDKGRVRAGRRPLARRPALAAYEPPPTCWL